MAHVSVMPGMTRTKPILGLHIDPCMAPVSVMPRMTKPSLTVMLLRPACRGVFVRVLLRDPMFPVYGFGLSMLRTDSGTSR